ncbi:hypothetical protein R1sor_011684 [Riccia sorocarpa]|uniref:Uncharacterized protein n=1 Tax=Riccia sorocarpa TaxID=122646 RepID=A0ABD3I1P3_9MARC
MPNANAAEFVYAACKKFAKKKQHSLLEVTMEDNAWALIQIARGHSFKLGRGGGKGPSLFELNLRATDRLGTTDAFQKGFEIAVRQTEPLKDILFTINDDITTKSHKQRGHATSTVNASDRVAVTSQVVLEAAAAEVESPAMQPSAEPQPTFTTLSSEDDFEGILPSTIIVPSAT